MNTIKLTLMALALLLVPIAANAQVREGEERKQFPKSPDKSEVIPMKSQMSAWDSFKESNETWKISWGTRSRVPSSLIGTPKFVTNGSPEEVARTFIESNEQLLSIYNSREKLALQAVDDRVRYKSVIFQQTYEGIPVTGAVYVIHMDSENKVYYSTGDYFDDVSLEVTVPSVSLLQAIEFAKSDLGEKLELTEEPEGELVVLPFGDEYKLAWKIYLAASTPQDEFRYYISATDGTILSGLSLSSPLRSGTHTARRNTTPAQSTAQWNSPIETSPYMATASGYVYEKDPDYAGYTSKTLTDLYSPVTELSGTYFEGEDPNYGLGPVEDSGGNFLFTDTRLDAVNVYYHATLFKNWLDSNVGYSYLNYPGSVTRVRLQTGLDTDNAIAHVTANYIVFGTGDGGVNFNNLATIP